MPVAITVAKGNLRSWMVFDSQCPPDSASVPGKRTLLVFTRDPEEEARVKHLPVAPGARLFEAFLRVWRQRAVEAGADLIVTAPPSSVGEMRRLLPDDAVVPQEGCAFCARVEAAFRLAFGRGASSALIVSGDSPPLDADEVEQAFAHLDADNRAMTLWPAADGGVNAIGFAAGVEPPLAGLSWLSPHVCGQLRALAQDLGLAVLLARPGHDLDSPRDVRALCR